MKSTPLKTALTCILLVSILLFLPCCAKKPAATSNLPSSSQASDMAFSLSSEKAAAGETVMISLSIENNPSIAGYSVTVCYDPQVLTFKSCENKVDGGFAVSNRTVTGKVRVMCTVMGGNALSHEGVCDLLTFTVNDDAPKGESALELILADSADAIYKTENGKMPSVACTLIGGTVTVQ